MKAKEFRFGVPTVLDAGSVDAGGLGAAVLAGEVEIAVGRVQESTAQRFGDLPIVLGEPCRFLSCSGKISNGNEQMMTNGIDGIDHPVIAVHDLELAKKQFERLGFTLTPRRSMVGWGTANYSIMLGDAHYLELLGIVDPGKFLTPGLSEFLAVGEGGMAVTLRAEHVDAANRALEAMGAKPSQLNEVTIHCAAPDGLIPQSFRWLKIGEEATPDMYLMLVQPLTPQNMRRRSWTSHANGANLVAAVTIAVTDPEALVVPYERLFGQIARKSAGGFEIDTGRGDFRFATPASLVETYRHDFLKLRHPTPTIAVLTLGASNLDQTEAVLKKTGTTYQRCQDQIQVSPSGACGIILEFVEMDSFPNLGRKPAA